MVCHGEQEAFIILRHTVEMHCDYLKGYLYSKPLPEGDYIAFLQRYL